MSEQQTLTYENVLELIQENSREFSRLLKEQAAEFDRRMLETERMIKEISEQILVTKQIKKNREEDHVRERSDCDAEYTIIQQKSERRRQVLDRKMERAKKNIREFIGFTGPFIDNMLDEGIIEQFQTLGYKVTHHVRNEHSLDCIEIGIRGEFDLTLVDTGVIILIKVEEIVETGDVGSHIEKITEYCRHLATVGFKKRHTHLLPETRFFGAVAGEVVTDEAMKFAHENGLYTIVQSGEAVEIVPVPEGFKAREW